MGVPALFRWLANKYPKITTNVVEEQPKEVNGVEIPIDITQPNPNNDENDYLYLDMNNIIHPCCKPEGKPPPTSEDEMFVAIFAYIERIVNMVRPRKMLYMAVDGVAPRAKMNQQRSRRFRTAQEAKAKAASEEAAWEELTPEMKAKRPNVDSQQRFDSNCITPGTPFMINLGKVLRYWVAKKLNEDPGWKNLKVILSDGSVPGEGEHKMMNFIRSQRASKHHNPNTSHVIYGLDADLIMLALGTHEPYFKVLREDVFFQEGSSKNKCFLCNQTGHQAAQCQGKAKIKSGDFDEKAAPATVKPYIYLNVSILREYLEIELKVENLPFEWDLEKAFDDWVFLCFFVGNDFLPHLPSLETREGAIDVLIEIWKQVLPLMGGYMTRNGEVDLKRAQFLMTELGKKEDSIFQERREKEERRMKNNKRRKVEDEAKAMYAQQLGGDALSQSQNQNQNWSLSAVAVKGLSMKAEAVKEVAAQNKKVLEEKLRQRTASNHAAAALLKAELAADINTESEPQAEGSTNEDAKKESGDETMGEPEGEPKEEAKEEVTKESTEETMGEPGKEASAENGDDADEKTDEKIDEKSTEDAEMTQSNPLKRPASEVDNDEEGESSTHEDDDTEAAATPTPVPSVVAKKKAVQDDDEEPEDNVRLWEPDYKERYYRNKFHIELSDTEARRKIVKSYIEGCCWVMKYYMQGCPSWQWYYPYHYSPFASDFVDIGDLEIEFEVGESFRPIEQLMGVLPAASKQHIPPAFQPLMYEEDSPIIDFYPEEFDLDLNGKKFAWQGVALLPFLDPKRLLDAMAPLYSQLTDDERERNQFGKEILFVSESSKLYDALCSSLYSSRGGDETVSLDYKKSGRLLGIVSRDPLCVPRSSFPSPLLDYGLTDISVDTSISVIFSNPPVPQGHIHQAVMLKGVNPPRRVLSHDDIQWIKNGGGVQRGGRGGRGRGRGGMAMYRSQNHGHPNGRGGGMGNRGRPGFTPDNRGAADRTYPGQSYDHSHHQGRGGGSGYGGYQQQQQNGPRYGSKDPYQGYDSHSSYDEGGRGSGRGGYGGYSGRGQRGSGYGSQGGYNNHGQHGGGNYSRGGGSNYQRGGYDDNQSHGGYGSQQGGYQGGHGGYGNNGGGSGGGHGGYNNGNSGGYGNSNRYSTPAPPSIPGFAPVNNYGPPQNQQQPYGNYGGGGQGGYGGASGSYGGMAPNQPSTPAAPQSWYGRNQRPPANRGGYNQNMPPYPYPRQ
ncbi:5'-3' exoribonuclease 2 [Lunasporangiospora selenospora]|uniref:5'-3' exoribonuclease n=1 Tax=Lunasporangiospora selenospora TaxID=979761 RepID=A0A9P6FVY3_9FUNG|nr:5'-3' exoribonuclease 2 [Lunasporangiospora selenospora]